MSAEMSKPAKREGNSAQLVYDQLRADILSGKLAPGTPLSQLALANLHGISRGPVREAMRLLQQDQLIIGEANRRFTVAAFDLTDLENVLSLHLANMALAIRVSVPFLTAEDLRQLDRHAAEMEGAVDQDTDRWEAAYRDYALALVKYAGGRVVSLIGDLIDNIRRYRINLLDRFPRVYMPGSEFGNITTAAHKLDGAAASEHFAEFFGRVAGLILAGASPRYDAARLRGYIETLASSEVVPTSSQATAKRK